MILLTAQPKTGKTTALMKIINVLGKENCRGFYTEEIIENGERVGFSIATLSGKKGTLSHVRSTSKERISKYGVNVDEFENICVKELEEAISDANTQYIIIDEIGPMEVLSEKYRNLLMQLLTCDKPVIGAIFKNPHEWLDEFKKNNGIELVEVTVENRDDIPLKIVNHLLDNYVDAENKQFQL